MRIEVKQARDSVLSVIFIVKASSEERVAGCMYQKEETGQKWNWILEATVEGVGKTPGRSHGSMLYLPR